MLCANPDCCSGTFELPGGSIWWIELEESLERSFESDDNGLPTYALPTKYFWLCAECSQQFVLSRWKPRGIVLRPSQYWTEQNVEHYGESPRPRGLFLSSPR